MALFTRSNAKDLLEQAIRARESGNWARAAGLFRRALAADPGDPENWAQFGRGLRDAGRLAEAEAVFARALDLDPAIAATHVQAGIVFKLAGRSKLAEAAYLRALALEPAQPDALHELAACGWSRQQVEEARRLSQQAELEDADLAYVAAKRHAGDQARDRRDWAAAADAYQAVVDADPTAADIAVQLGHARKEMGQLERAAAAYRAAQAITPEDDDLQLQIGHLEKLRGDFAKAAGHYRRALELNPGNPHAAEELKAVQPRAAATQAATRPQTAPTEGRAAEIFRKLRASVPVREGASEGDAR